MKVTQKWHFWSEPWWGPAKQWHLWQSLSHQQVWNQHGTRLPHGTPCVFNIEPQIFDLWPLYSWKDGVFSPDSSAHDQADRQDGVHPLLAWAIEAMNFCWSFLSINNHYFLLHFSATTSFTSTRICIIYYFYYISLPVLVLMKSLPAIMQTREAWTIWTRLYNCQMLQLATAILWISSPFILCL